MKWVQGTIATAHFNFDDPPIRKERRGYVMDDGCFGVHRDGGAWVVTHLPTGMCLPCTDQPTRELATAMAEAVYAVDPKWWDRYGQGFGRGPKRKDSKRIAAVNAAVERQLGKK